MITREEAIEELERLLRHWDDLENGKRCFWGYDNEAVALALSALRPVSRERIEKMWMGHWVKCKHADYYVCNKCSTVSKTGEDEFCKSCGAPMTDEAVEMVMERLEALKDGNGV